MSEHRIAAIEISQHRLALDPPFNASWDSNPRRQFDATLVKVTTKDGVAGYGSGDLMLGFAGHEPLFVGRDPFDIERHATVLEHIAFHYGRCWPLDLALWDLIGKLSGQPCWKLLGGATNRVRAYASSGVLRDGAEMADAAERYRAEGFAALKIRFRRGDWRADVRALETVRARVGDTLELMVDCNQGWRMPWDTEPPWALKEALEVARALEPLGVYWMEEPLDRADYDGMAALREATAIRIAGGEMTRELSAFDVLVARGCLDVLQPDAALVGGITGLRKLAATAREHSLTFTPHTWTNGMGVVANAQLVAGLGETPFLEFPYDPPQWSLARRDFLMAEPLAARDGWIELSDAPGMGYAVDEARLKATRVG
ncbi:MAG TPA: mandelate racemase/muconate lactonizing enzyme family protein [Caulobacteraceae bacterium]|nr:mandelate racemase/muconate lactonizing enzyme family protein [Caulobacteraceae bacterium]